MDDFYGFEVMERPINARRMGKWNGHEILSAFIESGNDCMGKRYDSVGDAKLAYMALRNQVRRDEQPVFVSRRGDVVFLIRKDGME